MTTDNTPTMSLSQARTAFRRGDLDKMQYIAEVHAHHSRLFQYQEFLAESDVAELRIRADEITVVCKSTGVELVLDPTDEHLTPMTLLNFGAYEVDELQVVMQFAGEAKDVLDIGANIGWYSIQLARKSPNARIYAFEPMEKTCRHLSRNLELNGVNNVEIIKQGVSDKAGEQTFFYTEECSGATSMKEIPHLGAQSQITRPVTTVDAFVQERGLAPSFIKCDVEGAELLVVRGALETLRTHRPALLVEMLRKWSAKFDYHPNDIIDRLSALGYVCCALGADGPRLFDRMNDDTVETNFVFLHREVHHDKIPS